ncbi:neuroblastoma breakpoint family member 6-like [Cavia porcellus]|uniref:neuroblastoma breakpoint family member 6-like n=1 Tax=Cavia porcellus TaxID=10141 RepID=UPI002FE39A58
MRSLRHKVAEGCKLAKCLAHKLSPGNLDDEDEDDDDQMTLDSSVCEEEENEVLSDSLDDKFFQPSCHPNVANPQKCASSTTFSSQKPEDCSAKDGPKLNLDVCLEMKTPPKLESDAFESSAVITDALTISGLCDNDSVLKQKIIKRKLWLCKWKIACRFPSLQATFDASHGMKNPPKLEGDAFEGLAAIIPESPIHGLCDADSVLKQKIIKRKLQLCKWKMACRFPSLQATFDASHGMKNPPKLEGDAFEGLAAIIPESPIHGLCDADSVLKQKIIKRKLWLCKWKIACRFPSLQATFDASHGMKNPPKLEGDAFEGLAAIIPESPIRGLCDADSVLKQKIIKRKLQLCKWKMACRFPSLQATFDASHGMKNPPKLEGDAFEGLAAIIPESPIHGLCDADSVLKQKIIKRKLQLCKWKMACRFPGFCA